MDYCFRTGSERHHSDFRNRGWQYLRHSTKHLRNQFSSLLLPCYDSHKFAGSVNDQRAAQYLRKSVRAYLRCTTGNGRCELYMDSSDRLDNHIRTGNYQPCGYQRFHRRQYLRYSSEFLWDFIIVHLRNHLYQQLYDASGEYPRLYCSLFQPTRTHLFSYSYQRCYQLHMDASAGLDNQQRTGDGND
jgi:hypothetical protein